MEAIPVTSAAHKKQTGPGGIIIRRLYESGSGGGKTALQSMWRINYSGFSRMLDLRSGRFQ
jgi:hypothetical protein